jgi:hypothetical protein
MAARRQKGDRNNRREEDIHEGNVLQRRVDTFVGIGFNARDNLRNFIRYVERT